MPRHPLKATLDRLIPEEGYTKNNVVWSSSFANIGRNDTPVKEFKKIVKNIKNNIINN